MKMVHCINWWFRVIVCVTLLGVFTTQAERYCRFGKESHCTVQCHCDCDPNTGVCRDECDPGWSGPQCQIGNIALGKQSYCNQAGRDPGDLIDPNRAIDGNTNTEISTLINNAGYVAPAFWYVDLGEKHVILNITIVHSDQHSFKNAYLAFGNSTSFRTKINFTGNSRSPYSHNNLNIIAQYVGMMKYNKDGQREINILEFLVVGYKYINCTDCEGSCDNMTGCKKCIDGRLPQDCERGRDRFGENGVFDCHCIDGEVCDSITGHCSNGCEDGWEGPQCQTGNVAYGKKAVQSGTHPGYDASRAVDGLTPVDISECTRAWSKFTMGKKGWWQVDLGRTHRVISVTLFNTNHSDAYDRLRNIKVSLSNSSSILSPVPTECATFPNVPSGGNSTLNCLTYLVGRYVTVQRTNGESILALTLCEVIVYGHPTTDCTHCAAGSPCSEVTGCEICPQGKLLPDCIDDNPTTTITTTAATTTKIETTTEVVTTKAGTTEAITTETTTEITTTEQTSTKSQSDITTAQATAESPTTTQIETTSKASTTSESQNTREPHVTAAHSFPWSSITTTVKPTTSAATVKTTSSSAVKETGLPPNGTSIRMIVGILMAILVIAVIIIVIIVFILKRRKQSKEDNFQKESEETPLQIIAKEPQKQENPYQNYQPNNQLPVQQEPEPEQPKQPPAQQEDIYENTRPLIPKSYPIPVKDFSRFVEEQEAMNNVLIKEQYKELPPIVSAHSISGTMPQNRVKNRYKDILPYDQSRIILPSTWPQLDTDYINASYIPNYKNEEKVYVAAQGPLENSVEAFWCMIWELKANRIVMVTQLVENSKRKCHLYWPDLNKSMSVGEMSIHTESVKEFAHYIVREFTVKLKNKQHTVYQFAYTDWPDKDVPNAATLVSFRKRVRAMDSYAKGPMVVHCSAGIGRTGTFIALDTLIDQIDAEEHLDIVHYGHLMRKHRMKMIQTEAQYIFLHSAILEQCRSGNTAITGQKFEIENKRLLSNGASELQNQFKNLEHITQKMAPLGDSAGLGSENLSKNRDQNIVPENSSRPYLMTEVEGRNNYINAVFIESYVKKGDILLTQMPLKDTVVDFWRLISDYKIETMVLMETDMDESVCFPYWPEGGSNVQTYGPIDVSLEKEEKKTSYTIRHFQVKNKRGLPVVMRQYQYTGGYNNTDVPLNTKQFVEFLDVVTKDSCSKSKSRLLIQCLNGATKSGLFCVACHVLKRIELDNEIDVFESVKLLRLSRRQLICNIDQYKFLYDVADKYLKQTSIYQNTDINMMEML